MTLRARRWYYSLAILIFLVTAPLVVMTAAGWQWTGWRQGFVQTGTILVSGTERLNVRLNGELVGQTPKRIRGLSPGTYRLKLERSGRTPWERLVTVTGRTNTSIGPVRLFPVRLSQLILSAEALESFAVDQSANAIVGWSTVNQGVNLSVLWPRGVNSSVVVPEAPVWFRLSPRRQQLAVGTSTATLIYSLANPTTPRRLPPGDPVAWLDGSESITYRLRDGQIIADDALTTTATSLATATSIMTAVNALWSTTQTGDTTSLYLGNGAVAASQRLIASLHGTWTLVGSFDRSVVIRETTTRMAVLINLNRVTGRLEQVPLGGLDTIVATTSASHPLWLNGADVLTLTNDATPIVLLRSTEPLLDLAWIDEGHILGLVEARSFTARSISNRQGRGTLMTHPFAAEEKPLLLDPATASVLVNRGGRLERWQWK